MGGAAIMASNTMTGVIVSLLVVMALFYGTFNYVSENYVSANITDSLGYNQSYFDLQTAQSNLSSDIESIKSSAQGIGEADSNIVLVAWNGLTGLASTIRLMFGIVDVAVNVWNALLPGLSFLPDWTKVLVEIMLITWIIFIIIGLFKGESKT